MRSRDRILQNLEGVYKEAFQAARQREDREQMARLDLEYQRDQLHLEVLLDVRDLLATPAEVAAEKESSLLERAQALRQLTKLR